MIPYHAKSKEQVLTALNSDHITGLTQHEAEYRLKRTGLNKIEKEKNISKLSIFIRQFKSPLIYVLFFAIIICIIIKEFINAYVILAILFINSLLGFYQEYKAERALELLRKITASSAKVIRNKKVLVINAEELVPGDILILEEGDKIPADSRLIQVFNFKTNEAVLTGESNPIEKITNHIPETQTISLQNNMVFAGTTVSSGRARAVVTATGSKTEFGKLANSLQIIKEEETLLEKKLKKLSKSLVKIILISVLFLLILSIIRKIPIFESVMTAISIAVATIPEGLPIVLTVSLALGVQRMAQNKALVRKLSSIENLGSVTVICSDKTGTMTKGEMTVTQIYANNELIQVSGNGYDTKGNFKTSFSPKYDTKKLQRLLETGILCNNSQLDNKIGDPTELALLVVAKKANIATNFTRLDETPFDSAKKFMATLDSYENKKYIHLKGAPEVILDKCKYYYDNERIKFLDKKDRERILLMNSKMANSALRVLALAYSKENNSKEMIFLGLVGMIDPPREEAKEAIKLCKKAGIRVIMITGDNPLTAQAIAKELNLGTTVITGEQISNSTKEHISYLVSNVDIYARVNPEHKVLILEALQEKGEIVAMTGDGINDAPAMKKADIGIAMGISGTDVTRDSSDIILLDDNFNSIVTAVHHGRRIYDNTKKFVKFMLATNLGEIGMITMSLILSLPLPLLPLQILWANLITDSLPAIALGVDPAEKEIMHRKPRNPNESILKDSTQFLILSGILLTAIGISIFAYSYNHSGSLDKARTMVLTTLILFEILLVFVCRSNKKSMFKMNIFENKFLLASVIFGLGLQALLLYTPIGKFFSLVSLSLNDILTCLVFALVGIIILEIRKIFVIDETKNYIKQESKN
nr:hypothetical protein [Nanoarchaeum sp.]